MTDAIVRAQMIRWVSDDAPGWIEVSLVDADGREHRIVEKVPVLTTRHITAASDFPAELWLGVATGEMTSECVEVTFEHGVETTDGRLGVKACTTDVKWL